MVCNMLLWQCHEILNFGFGLTRLCALFEWAKAAGLAFDA